MPHMWNGLLFTVSDRRLVCYLEYKSFVECSYQDFVIHAPLAAYVKTHGRTRHYNRKQAVAVYVYVITRNQSKSATGCNSVMNF
jgi:hypothetical protein